MQILRTMKGCFLAALLFVAITGASVPTAGQTSQGSEPLALSAPVVPLQPSASGDRIFADLVKHNELRSARLREYSAVRTYAVTDLNGKVHAKEIVQMEYIAPDKKTFVTVAEEGSGVIRNLVLKRLMESEMSAAQEKSTTIVRSRLRTTPSVCSMKKTWASIIASWWRRFPSATISISSKGKYGLIAVNSPLSRLPAIRRRSCPFGSREPISCAVTRKLVIFGFQPVTKRSSR
jgi:hypothetical protein